MKESRTSNIPSVLICPIRCDFLLDCARSPTDFHFGDGKAHRGRGQGRTGGHSGRGLRSVRTSRVTDSAAILWCSPPPLPGHQLSRTSRTHRCARALSFPDLCAVLQTRTADVEQRRPLPLSHYEPKEYYSITIIPVTWDPCDRLLCLQVASWPQYCLERLRKLEICRLLLLLLLPT